MQPRPLLPTPGPHGGFMQGLPPGPPGMMQGPPPVSMGGIHPAPHVEPPAPKKPKTEDNLIPEHEFIASHPVSILYYTHVQLLPQARRRRVAVIILFVCVCVCVFYTILRMQQYSNGKSTCQSVNNIHVCEYM